MLNEIIQNLKNLIVRYTKLVVNITIEYSDNESMKTTDLYSRHCHSWDIGYAVITVRFIGLDY